MISTDVMKVTGSNCTQFQRAPALVSGENWVMKCEGQDIDVETVSRKDYNAE
ncbi:MAG: hypothetical protein MUE75_01735 [Algoriphagus sp.]|nr:hypothetical protein [Algoriphagus sp.]